jgi:CDP-diacylglycerol--glycerol-3-phosphate 3-phosphatidyltransferase
MFLYAGLIIIGAGIFDMVDGRVARQTNQVSVFGAFFDSVMDRYSDVAIFFGLLVYYARGNRLFYVGLVAFVMTACVMVSYTRARAEALIGTCKVGFMERPERIVCVILGALFNRWGVMAPASGCSASSPPSPSSTASATPTSKPSEPRSLPWPELSPGGEPYYRPNLS